MTAVLLSNEPTPFLESDERVDLTHLKFEKRSKTTRPRFLLSFALPRLGRFAAPVSWVQGLGGLLDLMLGAARQLCRTTRPICTTRCTNITLQTLRAHSACIQPNIQSHRSNAAEESTVTDSVPYQESQNRCRAFVVCTAACLAVLVDCKSPSFKVSYFLTLTLG